MIRIVEKRDRGVSQLDMAIRDRAALSGLFNRLHNMSPVEYNALLHAMWRLDREIHEMGGE